MTERREPTISAYSPSKEDIQRQQSQPQAQANRPQKSQQKARSSAKSPAAKPVVARSPLGPFALIVAIVACAASGFLYLQLKQAQEALVSADLRIADLESKFALSDDESTASTATMQAKLKWADSEIRKLWGVSYDTNRKAIASNKSTIAQVKKSADSAAKTIDSKVKSATQDIATDVKLVSDIVDAQQTSLASIELQNAEVVRSTQSLTDTLNRLESSRKELEKRIKTNEQAIEAIDAFRRQVNQQLLSGG